MDKLIAIGLIFENCEYVQIEEKFVKEFIFEDGSEDLRYINKYLHKGKIYKKCHLVLSKGFDENLWTSISGKEKINNPLERILQYDDITHIEVFYDKDKICFSVAYDGEENNKLQKSCVLNSGDLKIEIG